MIEINITTKELLEGLTCDKEHGLVAIDNYRRIIELDDNDFMALDYKTFIDLDNLDEVSVSDTLNFVKNYWDGVTLNVYGATFKKRQEDLIAKIMEVQEEYSALYPEDSIPVISGLVVCNDYPVGVILPKKMLEYKPLFTFHEEIELSREDIDNIFDGAKWWIEKLMDHGVYTNFINILNILVSPNDYGHVALDNLDHLGTCSMEIDKTVKEEAANGKDLRKNSLEVLEEFRNRFYDYNKEDRHFI